MMNRILYPIVCFFVLSFQPGQLTSQTVLSMDECVRKALAQDLQRQIAGLQLSIAGTNNHGSVAGRYPTIRLNTAGQGNLNDQNNPASFLNGLIRSGNANLSLDATWLVFNGFRVRYNLKQLGTLEEQARVRLNVRFYEAPRLLQGKVLTGSNLKFYEPGCKYLTADAMRADLPICRKLRARIGRRGIL